MSINAMMQSGLSALLTNQVALRTTSSNISNVNNPDYVRRSVQFETQTAGDLLGGVQIGAVQRAVDVFLQSQRLGTATEAGRADAVAAALDQLQRFLGRPDQASNPAARLAAMGAGYAQLMVDPASALQKSEIVGDMRAFASSVTDLAGRIEAQRAQADADYAQAVERLNDLTRRISDLNRPIQAATISGDLATPLRDERDAALRELAGLLDIRVSEDASGRTIVTTPSGLTLVSDGSAEASYSAAGAASYSVFYADGTVIRRNPATGAQIGPTETLERHVQGGTLRGLLDLRDSILPRLGEQLSALASGVAEAVNAAHNASSAWPAPRTLEGSDTGLLASDSLGFSGRASVAIVDSAGALIRRVDIDFDAGAIAVDGGAPSGFGATVGGFVSALNAALGPAGSATFAGGRLTLAASAAGSGVAVGQDPAVPATRAGRGFAHAFGLNDVFSVARGPAVPTGLAAADAHGFAAGQSVQFAVRAPDGSIAARIDYAVGGTTIGDLVAGLNAAAGSAGTFSLDGQGRVSFAPSASGGALEVVVDSTRRGATGATLSSLFGLGRSTSLAPAETLAVREPIASRPALLATAQLDLRPTSTAGSIVLASGDNRGVQALIDAQGARAFPAAGFAPAGAFTPREYGANLLAEIGQQSARASSAASDAGALKGEIDRRAAAREGVNLDEELANMMVYQQAYNAGARLITTAQKMMDELLKLAG